MDKVGRKAFCASGYSKPNRYCLLLLLLIIALLPTLLRAQAADDEDDLDSNASFASLAVTYDARGNASVTFNSFGIRQDVNGIEAVLEPALHCPVGTLVTPPPKTELPKYMKSRPLKEQQQYLKYAEESRKNMLQGTCPGAMTRTGLLLSTNIPLTQVKSQLKRDGVQEIWVQLTYPRSKFSEQTNAGQMPDDPDEPVQRSVRAELYSHVSYRIVVSAESPDKIRLAFGLRRHDAIRAAALPAVFLLSPIFICFLMRGAAIRDAKIDPTGAWFSYFRVLVWSGNCLLLIWIVGNTIRRGLEDLTAYYTAAHTPGAVALRVAIIILPPWISYLVCILLSYKVYISVRGERWTLGQFQATHSLALASQLLPLMCLLAAFEMVSINGQATMALFMGVYASYKICNWLNIRITGSHLEPLTTGELRDRVFELAKKAAVEIRQVFIMPAGKSQMANAFASRNHSIFFTDYLLSRLNRREVLAVAAHEVTHIQKRHSTWKGVAFIGLILSPQILFGLLSSFVGFLRHSLEIRRVAEGPESASGLAALVRVCDQVLAFPELILFLYVFALVLFFLQSRYMEHVADTGAVQLSGDPDAVITSLLKLGRLNLLPMQWDRITGSLLTHPSTLKRAQRVAAIAQIPPLRLEQLLHDFSQPVEKHVSVSEERFHEAKLRDPVVNAINASEQLEFKKWVLRFFYIAPPALIASAVHHYQLHHRAASYILGAITCFVLYALVAEWQAVWGRRRLQAKFLKRLHAEGIAVEDYPAELIALSPHACLRGYALGLTWDTGFLFFTKNRLCYVGDQVRFALKPDQIVGVRLGPGVPDWLKQSRIYIDWQPQPNSPIQTWNIVSESPCPFWRIRQQIQTLNANLLRWKMLPADFPEASLPLSDLPAPAFGEVTNHPIKSIVTFRRFVKVAFFNQILAIVVSLALRVPSVPYVCCIDFLLVAYSFSPFWFYKDPETVAQTSPLVSGGEALQGEV